MLARAVALALLATGTRACLTYEYEHEIWLRVDGSGTVNVTGRPALWTAFKGLGGPGPDAVATPDGARALFERSGLRVRRVTLTHRGGHPYLFVSADFRDVNALAGTPAFPDLVLGLRAEGGRLQLDGRWARPPAARDAGGHDREGLMAVRLHLPSKVYAHRNAADGVERGNIVSWRQDVAQALDGRPLDVGAEMDERSILLSTVFLFATAIAVALAILGAVFYALLRRGRRELARAQPARDDPRSGP
jgi:hypothetical protein